MDLPPSVPSPASGSPSRFGFMRSLATYNPSTGGLHWVRHTDLPVSRPTSQRFSSPDIRTRLVTTARPLPLCHLVGSLFATYTGSASCFLQTPHFWKLPLPCWRYPSVRLRRVVCSTLSVVYTASASCQTHIKIRVHGTRFWFAPGRGCSPFLNFSSLQTMAPYLLAEPINSDLAQRTRFSRSK